MGLNTWCHSNSVSFKSHSISVTFKFCAVRVALSALEHPAPKFECNTNRMTPGVHTQNEKIVRVSIFRCLIDIFRQKSCLFIFG